MEPADWGALDGRLFPYAGTDAAGRARAVRTERDTERDRLSDEARERTPGLSVVVLTLDLAELMVPLARILAGEVADAFAERGLGLEVVIGDTGSADPELLALYEDPPEGVRVLRGLDYHFARLNNRLFAEAARHDTVLFLNNDIRLPGPGPVLGMWDALEEAGGGIAGHLLHYPGGRVQHAGIDFYRWGPSTGLAHHPGIGAKRPPADFAPVRRVPGVTGACLMIGAELFRRCGGFDPGYEVELQDVDLCLRAHRLGEPSLLVASGEPVHHLENATRTEVVEHWPDRRRLLRRWSQYVAARFPEPARP